MIDSNPNMPMTVPSSPELPKAGQIFDEAWIIYKNLFKTLVAITIMPTLVYLVFIGLFAGGSLLAQKLSLPNSAALNITGVIFLLIAAICVIYLYVWATAASLFAIKDQAENINWQESYKRSKNKIGNFFVTELLAGLAVFGGFILLIVPGIIFSLWFSQSGYVVVEEDLSATTALKKSKYYVKGRLGQVFRKLFYIGIISFAIYIVLNIFLTMLSKVIGIDPSYTSWLNIFYKLIWGPMVTVYTYQLYKHLKASRP